MNKDEYSLIISLSIETVFLKIFFIDKFSTNNILRPNESFVHRFAANSLTILFPIIIDFLSKSLNRWKFFNFDLFLLLLIFLFVSFLFIALLKFDFCFFLSFYEMGIFPEILNSMASCLHVFFVRIDIIIEGNKLCVLSESPFSQTIVVEIKLVSKHISELFINKVHMSESRVEIPLLEEGNSRLNDIPVILKFIWVSLISHE